MTEYDLRDSIDRLESLDGDGTELVTITVRPDDALTAVRERVADEYAAAENIKSDRTRERVQRALDRIQRHLREYDATPENGLAVCAGVVDGDLVSHAFDDLPDPIGESTYTCSDHFNLDAVRAVVTPSESFGLVVVERGRAAVGRLVGNRVVPTQTMESQVMGKFRAGGQSAQRFARERDRQKHEFFQSVADTAKTALCDGDDTVTGVAVGGTLTTAKEFVSGGYLDHRLRDRVLGTYSVPYATEQGLEHLVDAASDDLLDARRRTERDQLASFFTRLRDSDPVAYGSEDVETAIEYGAVDTALVSTALPGDRRAALEDAVADQGGDVCVISTATEDGCRFADAFGGLGALLRFPIE